MFPRRILGIVLFTTGGIFVMAAMSSYQSVVDQVSTTLTGRFTQANTWYFFGGMSAGILGLLMLLLSPRQRSA
jgi:hypothetical protein